jgi:hypothetical protein
MKVRRIRICKLPDRSDADTGKLPACASPDIQKIGRGKRPYNSLVVLPADQRDRIRFLIIGAKLCKDLVPGNTDADRGLDRLSSVLLDAEWTFNDWILTKSDHRVILMME